MTIRVPPKKTKQRSAAEGKANYHELFFFEHGRHEIHESSVKSVSSVGELKIQDTNAYTHMSSYHRLQP